MKHPFHTVSPRAYEIIKAHYNPKEGDTRPAEPPSWSEALTQADTEIDAEIEKEVSTET